MMSAPYSYPPVSLLNTEQRQIHSTIIDQDYLVKVRLPEPYYETPDKTYPVLYLLDGDHAFGMAVDITQYLIYGGHIPDLIIVSPAYGSKLLPHDGGTNMRVRDLLPFAVSDLNYSIHPQPGGEAYLRFLEQELLPFAESEYRIDPTDRTLWGYSLGGMFLFYALFSGPALFHRYLLIDGWHGGLRKIEERYAERYTDLPFKLYMGYCDDKPNPELIQFVNALESRKYRGLTLKYDLLNDTGHFAVGAEGLTKGLVWVFGDGRR
jgi:predicted alpha/beta superfamily hydrolase